MAKVSSLHLFVHRQEGLGDLATWEMCTRLQPKSSATGKRFEGNVESGSANGNRTRI
jgi:hypothetical protein